MQYEEFKNILNHKIFEESKADLIRKFADYPRRYIGLFRPTKPKGKIIQNLTQSQEIKFGDAFEIILEEYFKASNFSVLPKIFRREGKKSYVLDQLFIKDKKIVFIEQKVRDDHDSTKKRGQIDNFIRKIKILEEEYPEVTIRAFFYFLDPSLKKNQKYYKEKIKEIKKDYNIECHLFYGSELLEFFKIVVWREILSYLKKWKDEIPEMPEINFDINVDDNFEEIKDIEPNIFLKILKNDAIFNDMILTISPEKKLLNKLLEYFKTKSKQRTVYKTIANLLEEKLKN